MKRATLLLAILSVLVGGGRAEAGLIHGSAQVSGLLEDRLPVNDGPNYGLAVSASASKAGSQVGGSGHADVNLVELPGFNDGFTWQLHTDAQVSWNAFVSFFPPPGFLTSNATWQDVLVLSNTDPALVGHTLRLNFYADLFLNNTATGPGDVPWAGTLLTASGTNIANPSQSDIASQSAGTNLLNPRLGIPLGILGSWDTLQAVGGGFYHGTFHLDIPIVPGQGYIAGQPGSFYYSLLDQSSIGGQAASGVASAGDPSGFTSITLPDVGNVTPESLGVSVTFQSGIVSPDLQPSAVPEPSSLALTLTGLGWRRRRTAAAKKAA